MSHTTGGNTNRKLHGSLLIVMLVLFALVFNRRLIRDRIEPPAQAADTPNLRRARNAWNQTHADSALHLVKEGDLVLRAGSDAISALFKRANTRDKTYSHGGLVFIENGTPMVYHCIGSAEEPKALLRRDSLKAYIGPLENTGYAIYRYRLRPSQVEKLHELSVRFYRERRAFDPYFDLATDSALYCTEFVYKALLEITGDKNYLPLTHTGSYSYIAADNLFSRKDIKLVCRIGYIQ